MDDAAFDRALIAAAFQQAAAEGWRSVSVAGAARAASLPLARARERFPGRAAILLRFGRLADQAALTDAASDGTARDRLFDLLMRRFDLLQPHRDALRSILRATRRDPLAAACARSLARAMASTLEAAGLSASGLSGLVRVKGLSAIYLAVLRRWLGDESEDKAATMAMLDRLLNRAERGVALLHCRRSRPEIAEAAA